MTCSRPHRLLDLLAIAALFALNPACSGATPGPDPSAGSMLFIGNSLTYYNDLPALVVQVAEAMGDSVGAGMATRGNTAVIDHTIAGSEALARIAEDHWDYVVLQQGPTPAGICRDTLVIAAMRLAPRIRAAGGRPVLFLPWARQAFPQSLGPAAESATAAARAVGGAVVPVGIAWKEALEADPDLPLYGPDGYHPAPTGTLLAALTVYDRLSGRDVSSIPVAALARIAPVALASARLEAMAGAAHRASTDLPADPAEPEPADTTVISPGGGPC
jgi:hypothetical protein